MRVARYRQLGSQMCACQNQNGTHSPVQTGQKKAETATTAMR